MALNGKVAIVTGAARGFGQGFAEAILQNGGKVTVCDVLDDVGQATVKTFAEKFGKDKVLWSHCDVTKEEDWEHTWVATEKHFGIPVDLLINNAGINHVYGWRKCMDVDIMGVMIGTNLAYKKMGRVEGSGRGGHIINVASMAGILSAVRRESVSYFVAKSGVVALSKSMGQKEVVDVEGVRVDCICPLFANTQIVTDHKEIVNFAEKYGELIPISQVVDAFLCLAEQTGSGRIICVLQKDLPHVYWPAAKQDLSLLYWFITGAQIAKKIKPDLREFTRTHQVMWLLVTLFITYFILKMALCVIF